MPTVIVRSGQSTYVEYGEGPISQMKEIEELDDYPRWPDPELFHYQAANKEARRAREFGFATIGPWLSHFEI